MNLSNAPVLAISYYVREHFHFGYQMWQFNWACCINRSAWYLLVYSFSFAIMNTVIQ